MTMYSKKMSWAEMMEEDDKIQIAKDTPLDEPGWETATRRVRKSVSTKIVYGTDVITTSNTYRIVETLIPITRDLIGLEFMKKQPIKFIPKYKELKSDCLMRKHGAPLAGVIIAIDDIDVTTIGELCDILGKRISSNNKSILLRISDKSCWNCHGVGHTFKECTK